MVVAIVNQKGGVGKSTIAVHLAGWLREKATETVLVDSDRQKSSSGWLARIDPAFPAEVLWEADEILDAIDGLVERYTHVVLDGPGALSEVTRTLMLVADVAVIPITPSALDVTAAMETLRQTEHAQKIRNGQPRVLVIPNRYQSNTILSRDLVEAFQTRGIETTEPIPARVGIAGAATTGDFAWRGDRGLRERFDSIFNQITKEL